MLIDLRILGRGLFVGFIESAEYQCVSWSSTDRDGFILAFSVVQSDLLWHLDDFLLIRYQLLVIILTPDMKSVERRSVLFACLVLFAEECGVKLANRNLHLFKKHIYFYNK